MGEFRLAFADVACEFEWLWQLMFGLNVAFLVMLGGVALIVEPGSASYYVTVIAALVAAPLAVATGGMVRFCA